MINADDVTELLSFVRQQDLTITIEAGGHKKTFRESNCSKAVSGSGSGAELQRLLMLRMLELARDILHERGELSFEHQQLR